MIKQDWSAGDKLLASDLNNNFSVVSGLIKETSLASAGASIELDFSDVAVPDNLRVVFFSPDTSADEVLRCQVNDLTTGIYNIRYTKNGSATSSNSQTNWELSDSGSGTGGLYLDMRISNLSGFLKIGNFQSVAGATTITEETRIGGITINNTTGQITKIKFYVSSGTMAIGTSIRIYNN